MCGVWPALKRDLWAPRPTLPVNVKTQLSFLSACLWAGAVQAQNFMGVAPTNYGGTHSLYLNPSAAADSRYRIYVNLGAANFHLNNDYAQWVGPFRLTQLLTGNVPEEFKNSDGGVALQPKYFREQLDGRPKQGTVWSEVRGPSILLNLGSKTGIALTTRLRAAVQVDGASERLLSLVRLGLDVPALWNVTNVDNRFNTNANVYTEIGGTLARTLVEGGPHFLKVGGTVKYLSGVYGAYVNNRDLAYRVIPTGTTGRLLLENLDAQFGYVRQASVENSLRLGTLFGQGTPGQGWGLDVGVTYEFRPFVDDYRYQHDGDERLDPEENKYKVRLGVALLDLGRITYQDPTLVQNYQVQRSRTDLPLSVFDDVKGSDELLNTLVSTLEVRDSEITNSFSTGLPAALSANADLRLGNEFYVNVAVLQNLRGREAISLRQPNVLAITPRIEASELTIAIPLQVINNHFTFGAALQLGPLMIGSDNLIGLLGGTKTLTPQGVDAYAGVAIPLRARKPSKP